MGDLPSRTPRCRDARGWLLLLVAASLAVFAAGVGCGSTADTTTITFGGVEVTVPSNQSRRDTLISVARASAEKTGFSDEWRDCVVNKIEDAPDSVIDDDNQINELTSSAGTDCADEVNGPAMNPDATADQVDAARTAYITELGLRVKEDFGATEEQATCFTDHISTLSDKEMINYVNSNLSELRRMHADWARDCG